MANKTKINGGFIVLPKNTIKCNQWKELTPHTRVVYLAILTAFYRNGKSNPKNEVAITHRQLEEISGVSHMSVVRAMRALKKHNFISVIKQGGLEYNHSTYKLNGRYLF